MRGAMRTLLRCLSPYRAPITYRIAQLLMLAQFATGRQRAGPDRWFENHKQQETTRDARIAASSRRLCV